MTVLCGCHVDDLRAINEPANAWVWLRNRGWRKLDNTSTQVCTRLLALAALAKQRKSRGRKASPRRSSRPAGSRVPRPASGPVPPAAQEMQAIVRSGAAPAGVVQRIAAAAPPAAAVPAKGRAKAAPASEPSKSAPALKPPGPLPRG